MARSGRMNWYLNEETEDDEEEGGRSAKASSIAQ
jgi:hypothetical protein